MESVTLAALADAVRNSIHDGTASQATPALDHTSTVVYSLDTPAELTGARDTPESALANLITLLETAGILTDATTET